MEMVKTAPSWLLVEAEADEGAEWVGVRMVYGSNLCLMKATLAEINTNRLTRNADNVNNKTLVQSCQSFQTIQWIFYSRNVFTYTFAGVFIAVLSMYLPSSIVAVILSLIGLGVALLGLKLTNKQNPTDVGPLGKVEELIAKISVANCFVSVVDTGVKYAEDVL